jgi:hypothetical protein
VGAGVGLAMFGNGGRSSHRFGNGALLYWPPGGRAVAGTGARRFVRDAFYRGRDSRGVQVARTTFGQTTFEKLAAHNVRFGPRWSPNDAAIAK